MQIFSVLHNYYKASYVAHKLLEYEINLSLLLQIDVLPINILKKGPQDTTVLCQSVAVYHRYLGVCGMDTDIVRL